MKATRIKWDEAMLIRCLARLEDYNTAPVVVKQKDTDMEEVNDFSMKFDIPVESPAADSEAVVNDFSLEFDMPEEIPAADSDVEKKSTRPEVVKKAADYTFKWDKLPAIMFNNSGAEHKKIDWQDFGEAIEKAM